MNPVQPLPGAATTATLERTIEWVDTDAAGHQHNSAVLRFVEACEAKLFRDLDLPEYFPSAPRVRQELNYRAKLFFGQRVTTTVVVEKIGGASMTFSFEVWGEEFGGEPRALAAHGSFVTAHVARGAKAASPWPAEFRARITARQG
ncbi:thioesterase family protein [Arthrobacter sp. B3I4]|uniref:acyl-CoA thioesterase n=1 Tax=Arthrobacter sp. B3I4 TaxID=3042267 RepID=UPI002780C522|nr:thioesterase family protein [Arthrobacter sp. B3I4]MDQ0754934.1 acyl-CoA thioester hydrolase [Arthrobacter sp. B3I4]